MGGNLAKGPRPIFDVAKVQYSDAGMGKMSKKRLRLLQSGKFHIAAEPVGDLGRTGFWQHTGARW